ncbi:MAG: hypothetical protein A2Y98_00520 [Candidatus Portnoybacteria bacterium RBG_19FT_COMBO_36_7]|uniref:Uncharacterized protein n=1 Tax=Candidatus Portnoybacteria bacterium RBG_19FT_COMBO_36_7 TaxID=1801992 RepID=A0A1G2F7A7_9BACT|nr:MAG: hypothetical protein A2Y98_00520 [Candidatus Portnoybacteria bacterium RBG_19FT_COMBO_36_7]
MNEQYKFPFKKEEDEKKMIGKTFKGRLPTPEEDEELTGLEGGVPISKEKKDKAAKEAFKKVREL